MALCHNLIGEARGDRAMVSMTPRLDDAICEKRNPTETKAALKRLLRIAEAREWELSFCAGELCEKA